MKKYSWTNVIPVLTTAMLLVLMMHIYGRDTPAVNGGEAELYISYDRAIAEGLDEMVSNADWIVLGRYTAFDSTWNMSRDPNDPSKPSDDQYTEGRIYRFQVEHIYKGELAKTEILVSHRYSQTKEMRLLDSQGTLTTQPVSFVLMEPLYQEPVIGDEYVLFLTQGYTGYYQSPAHPFQIRIDNNAVAHLCSPLTAGNDTFFQTVNANGRQMIVSIDAGTAINDWITGMSKEALLHQLEQLK